MRVSFGVSSYSSGHTVVGYVKIDAIDPFDLVVKQLTDSWEKQRKLSTAVMKITRTRKTMVTSITKRQPVEGGRRQGGPAIRQLRFLIRQKQKYKLKAAEVVVSIKEELINVTLPHRRKKEEGRGDPLLSEDFYLKKNGLNKTVKLARTPEWL